MPLDRRVMVQLRAWKTGAEQMGVRITLKLKGWWTPMEPKRGWRGAEQ